jgi:hypothetical protein
MCLYSCFICHYDSSIFYEVHTLNVKGRKYKSPQIAATLSQPMILVGNIPSDSTTRSK